MRIAPVFAACLFTCFRLEPAVAGEANNALSQPVTLRDAARPARPHHIPVDPAVLKPDTPELSEAGADIVVTLEAGDEIRIKSLERPELNGDYRIREDGAASLPLLGAVTLAGRTLEQAQGTLRADYEMVLQSPVALLLDVSEWRPVTVLGSVDKPGNYPFKGRMSVLNALGAAGGIYRPARGSLVTLEVMREATRFEQAAHKLKQALVRKDRLTAEREGKENWEASERLRQIAKPEEVERLVASERRIMQERRIVHEKKKEALADQQRLIEGELEALTKQAQKNAEQIDLMSAEVGVTEDLTSRGLTSRSNKIERQLQLATMQATASEIVGQRMRAEQALRIVRRDIDVADPDRRILIEQDLELAEKTAVEQEIEMRAASDLMSQLSNLRVGVGMSIQSGEKVAFEITRHTMGGPKSFIAQETTPLIPGDVLRVTAIIE